MTTKLINIGNSMGIRIPKTLIQQYDLSETEIELRAEDNGILITPIKKARTGWEEMFSKEKGKVVIEQNIINVPNEFDETEWIW